MGQMLLGNVQYLQHPRRKIVKLSILSPNGGFVDKSGVALTSGGGTLVLASSGNVIGPGGQDVMLDSDGPILIYRRSFIHEFTMQPLDQTCYRLLHILWKFRA
ncbi:hypothetical protein D9615_002838 [Tricholomella constricta]|uniref:Uncharacterized protein n=1 Tax=Tricholomella constricta TaxID=117010 RepID=A0A8H5HGU2_9AGAR|nr:hypothetical protein D9615_002838 [Tricholomella constricta]